ncbi:MAG: TIGR02217 family protein [Armatimonadetes bacterium CG_4_8_14_3_um_filter_58_9]|nr:MAG: TIGR02217 family protein [Armatimonadetes bacterium CG_4_8_14_3_um_filter_58_9]
MDFHEVRFPTSISKGSSGGPRRRTDIVTLRSGYEERNSVWADSRREYDAGLGIRNINDMHDVLAFFEARLGRLYGFRWKDWTDYKSCPPMQVVASNDQTIGTGNGTSKKFQLKKAYTSGPATYTRVITKPVSGTVLVEVNGVLISGANYSLDLITGIITLVTAPLNGHVVKAGFEFDVPVRFANDVMDISVEQFNAGSAPQVNVIEVKTTLGVLD